MDGLLSVGARAMTVQSWGRIPAETLVIVTGVDPRAAFGIVYQARLSAEDCARLGVGAWDHSFRRGELIAWPPRAAHEGGGAE